MLFNQKDVKNSTLSIDEDFVEKLKINFRFHPPLPYNHNFMSGSRLCWRKQSMVVLRDRNQVRQEPFQLAVDVVIENCTSSYDIIYVLCRVQDCPAGCRSIYRLYSQKYLYIFWHNFKNKRVKMRTTFTAIIKRKNLFLKVPFQPRALQHSMVQRNLE